MTHRERCKRPFDLTLPALTFVALWPLWLAPGAGTALAIRAVLTDSAALWAMRVAKRSERVNSGTGPRLSSHPGREHRGASEPCSAFSLVAGLVSICRL